MMRRTFSLLLCATVFACSASREVDGRKALSDAAPPSGGVDGGSTDGGSGATTVAPPCQAPLPSLNAPEVCPAGWYLWDDRAGSAPMPDGGGVDPVDPVGDNRCYQRCTADGECKDPQRPLCRVRGLFMGGDYNCNGVVRVCSCSVTNECDHKTPP